MTTRPYPVLRRPIPEHGRQLTRVETGDLLERGVRVPADRTHVLRGADNRPDAGLLYRAFRGNWVDLHVTVTDRNIPLTDAGNRDSGRTVFPRGGGTNDAR